MGDVPDFCICLLPIRAANSEGECEEADLDLLGYISLAFSQCSPSIVAEKVCAQVRL
jgi:hypothetical protein